MVKGGDLLEFFNAASVLGVRSLSFATTQPDGVSAEAVHGQPATLERVFSSAVSHDLLNPFYVVWDTLKGWASVWNELVAEEPTAVRAVHQHDQHPLSVATGITLTWVTDLSVSLTRHSSSIVYFDGEGLRHRAYLP